MLPGIRPRCDRPDRQVRAAGLAFGRIEVLVAISFRHHGGINLPVRRESHHEFRQAEGQLVAAIHLPESPGLAVGAHELLQQRVLPGRGGTRGGEQADTTS